MTTAQFDRARKEFHALLLERVLRVNDQGVASNADKDYKISVKIARGIVERLGAEVAGERLDGQTSGNKFEEICASFLEATFPKLTHLRPGDWEIRRIGGRNRLTIAEFEQYAHLVALDGAARRDPELAAALGSDYTITPDIVVLRQPEPDEVINQTDPLINDHVARFASLRKAYNPQPILHASISCKWTMRSDRAQNSRSEALNLIRNRKGRLPHIAAVTAEPLPSRISSLALGTGDIDCVYHFALHELQETVIDLGLEDAAETLAIMVEGKRLRDISDLPLDLAV